jgi:16S rRNA (cytidine1402-2'-O)-methyltransferase
MQTFIIYRGMNKTTLYLIPTSISGDRYRDVLPAETLIAMNRIRHFVVENIRTARRFLKAAGYEHDFEEVSFTEMNKHQDFQPESIWMEWLREGLLVGVISEAGVPCVADPGFSLVKVAHEHNYKVVPLGGPSSVIKALMASGLNGQQFTFHGYLPVKPDELKRSIRTIEEQALKGYTQMFIETPYRNERMFEALLATCKPELLLCLAAAIDTPGEDIRTRTIREWKKHKPVLKGLPCVFLLGI